MLSFLQSSIKTQPENLLVFGNPDLRNPEYDLPFAHKEAQTIGTMWPGSRVLLRGQATETAVKSFGRGFRYIHFATHGTFDTDKPLESGLLLTRDQENDGKLTVGELFDLRLNADLVTLSACETALGKVASGDDVVGFTRGFLYAGANAIISTLWQVEDEATFVLMQQFYTSRKKTDRGNALREAQLRVKNNVNTHPYFWSAFQLTGAVQ